MTESRPGGYEGRKETHMKLTDMEAIKALKKARVLELEDMLSDYPESEVDGRTDWEMIANEAGWLLESCESDCTSRSDDLAEARAIVRQHEGRKPLEVQTARDTINEYNRLVRFVARLKKRGLHVPNY